MSYEINWSLLTGSSQTAVSLTLGANGEVYVLGELLGAGDFDDLRGSSLGVEVHSKEADEGQKTKRT